jgi:hypothetical protein
MENKVKFYDSVGNEISAELLVPFSDLRRGVMARFEENLVKVTEVFYNRREICIQLACEKKIPVLQFPKIFKPTSKRKNKIKIIPVVEVKPEPVVQEKPKKKVVAKSKAKTVKPKVQKIKKQKVEAA